jgi:transcriptional regulator with XRE-family HTH domain
MRGKESEEAQRILRDFGYRLRTLRDEKGLSQMALALMAGVHPTYVSNVERGKRNVSVLNLVMLAEALGVPVGDFFPSLDTAVAKGPRPKSH